MRLPLRRARRSAEGRAVRFRKSLAISAALHAGLLAATLIVIRPSAHRTEAIDHIPLELVDDISNDAQRTGERNAERTETPQAREVPQPTPRPDPTPVEGPRPVAPSSAPEPPPTPVQQAQPEPRPAPIPSPPQRPPEPQQTARVEEPPDEEGLLRRIEEDRRREQQQRQQEERRQREERERQARETRERQQREAREREQRERRERQQREARERRERERQQAQFDAQQMRDLINRQQGATQPQAQAGPTRTASLGNPTGRGQRLTQSQMALLAGMIRDQIAPCWSPPPGPQGANRAVVRIELLMNRDGSFSARPRVMNASSEPGFRPLADSALRAIERCARQQGNKLNLPAEMYDVPNGWREIEFAFDPSQMS